ncbi:hypothetical protein E2320_003425 [Naja naja]|nr:hypothetical protein E2320_003425 [Naja naja]
MRVLDMLPNGVCKVYFLKCQSNAPSPFLHKYHKPGDVIVGGIISQSLVGSEKILFRRHSFEDFFERKRKNQAIFFHWMFPNAGYQYDVILQLLLYFKWTWIGIFYIGIGSQTELLL